ncbi:triosephosphate isomerase [Methylocaldum marinum]|uniref:Triosephosphate isomerase n=1 Tax=Methylocaldum marinum TaxID=1432792 RepID=A0A250KQ56_9GAMM|nr:triose-phosphate isomerase [Methylocaldum marinum]BBA33738.1 triosephosphate isomerase [Methylocaldum marinum]
MVRRPLVVGNWKMNGTRESRKTLLANILSGVSESDPAEVGICAPYVFIPEAAELLKKVPILLGAQNVANEDDGPFTGEISARMLREFGCDLVIVGHSERRLLYGESNELVAARYKKALDYGLTPILCVGETLKQRERSETLDIIDQQLDAVVDSAGVESLANAVIAYEPVWAIGTGRTATVAQVQEIHEYLRRKISGWEPGVSASVRILYGGSVKPENARTLFGLPDVDGGLIGEASLDAESFLSICHSV